VDELIGKEEIVVKPLGAFLEGVGPFAGATISGEGRVILLLDPGRLASAAEAGARTPMPAIERAETAVPSMPATTEPRAPTRRVLLVDDSVSVRKVVSAMLERAGFSVSSAIDGLQALELLTADPSVDLIVTDLEMPRLNGYELIQDVRRRPTLRGVPVVVLTTRAGERHVELARQLGVTHYVAKPVQEATFVKLIESMIGRAGDARVFSEVGLGEATAR
jgi:chemosensory pili system protein ChpA (sensor histidine kinase/response regulator)